MKFGDPEWQEAFEHLKRLNEESKRRRRATPWAPPTIYREWTAHGLRCMIAAGPMSQINGYVYVPETHPWYGLHYNECPQKCGAEHCDHTPESVIQVHGGITWSSLGDPSGWVFGFDTGHAFDFMIVECPGHLFVHEGTIWDEDAVATEVDEMAQQLAAVSSSAAPADPDAIAPAPRDQPQEPQEPR